MAIINKLTAIADAIRNKTETTDLLTLDEMPSAIEGIQSGGVNGCEWVNYITDISKMFDYATFPDDTELDLYFPNFSTSTKKFELSYMFRASKGIKKIKIRLSHLDLVTNQIHFGYFSNGSSDLEEVDFEDLEVKSLSMVYAFNNCSKLKRIKAVFDMSVITSISSVSCAFTKLPLLEDVRFKEATILVRLSFAESNLLTDASIQSIIDGLATVTTAQTLTLHKDVKAKLTEEQIATITSKNWTLS